MSDRKHIDRLFQEKLKNFEATPDDAVWDELSQKLGHKQKNNRRIVPLWLKLTGIAAGLALLFVLGRSIINPNDNVPTDEIIVEQEDAVKQPLENEKDVLNENPSSGDEVVVEEQENDGIELNESLKNNNFNNSNTQTGNENAVVDNPLNDRNKLADPNYKDKRSQSVADQQKQNPKSPQNNADNRLLNEKKIQEELINNPSKEQNAVATAESKQKQNSTENSNTINEELPLSENNTEAVVAEIDEADKEDAASEIEKAIEDQNKEEEFVEDEESNQKRWSVAPNIAPVYFNTLGSGSSIDDQFSGNSKSGNINMSYGVAVDYKLNNKLSVRAGVNRLNIGYNTNNVIVYNNIDTDVDTPPLKNVRLSEQGQTLSFLSAEGINFAQVPTVVTQNIQSSIDQELGFIEIPLEVAYNISDSKLGVDLIGGFSTLFLNKNEVYSSLQGERTFLGEATNVSQTSFSANLGVGLKYKVSEKVNLKLEPTFKYQLNTFSETSGSFNPFVLGVYTGFSFKF